MAQAILEIARLQYAPREKPKTRFRMNRDEQSSHESQEDSDAEGSQPDVVKEIVDERFTIENVGQVSMNVDSPTKPLEIFGWSCLEYRDGNKGPRDTVLASVIRHNDIKGLKFLLDLGQHLTTQRLDPEDETPGFFNFPDSSFTLAIREGRTEILAEVVRRTGAGLSLEELVKHSGVELAEKPRYYQGLTVYGKKRKSWANAGRQLVTKQSQGTETSPLILAALAGRIESVEWFLSDAPLRLYLEFARTKAAREDPRMKHLSKQPGGVDKAVSTWLEDQNELVLHAAILARPCPKTDELVAYLIKSRPASLDLKSQLDITPLFLAARLGRTKIAKMLLDAGADQSIRNSSRENLLHAVLRKNPPSHHLESFLSLLDQALVQHMARDRDSAATDGGKTPLHRWLWELPGKTDSKTTRNTLAVLRLLLKHSGCRELDLLDAAGDTVLHTLVMKNNVDPALIRAVLDAKPELLYRENAVGRTPAEVARDRFVADKITVLRATGYGHNPNAYHRYLGHGHTSPSTDGLAALLSKPFTDFIDKKTDSSAVARSDDNASESDIQTTDESGSHVEQIWDICRGYLDAHAGSKRRLVSLHEANDVARRLGQQKSRGRYAFKLRATPEASDDEDEDEEEKRKRRAKGGADVVNQYWADPPHQEWWEVKDDAENDKVMEDLPVCEVCGDRHGDELDESALMPLCGGCGERHD